LIAEELGSPGTGGKPRVRAIMRRCLAYSILFGGGAGLALFFGAPEVGARWLGNTQTVLPLQVMAVSLPFLAMSSVLSGYFTAVRRVARNATVQIAEQLFKVVLTIGGLALFGDGLQAACLAIVSAGMAAELFSFTASFLLILSMGSAGRVGEGALPVYLGNARHRAARGAQRLSSLRVAHPEKPAGTCRFKNTVFLGTIRSPPSVPSMVLCCGGALPLGVPHLVFQLIVPELAECRARDLRITESRQIHYMMRRMFQVDAAVFHRGVRPALLLCRADFGRWWGIILPWRGLFRLFAPLVPIMYVDTVVDSMLKGLGEQVSSMRFNIIDAASVCCWCGSCCRSAVSGAMWRVIFVSEILNFVLSIRRCWPLTDYAAICWTMLGKPVLCIAVAALLLAPVLCMGRRAAAGRGAAAHTSLSILIGTFCICCCSA
jgi:stage V sporulation protein B